MATLKIWETVRAGKGMPVIRLDERMTYQAVAFTGTAAASAAFDDDTSIITVKSDVACAIAVGDDPTATADGFPLEADTLYDFEVEPGQKISAITVA